MHGYTQKEQGIKQRDSHLTQLDIAFHTLADNPNKGRNCDAIRIGCCKFRVKKHFIFYRTIDSNDIEIVRVLHDSMDTENNLGRINLK